MSEAYSIYEEGLLALFEKLGKDHPDLVYALGLEARLRENINLARRFGDTETRRAERHGVLELLNEFALKALDVSFNDLCKRGANLPDTEIESRYLPQIQNYDGDSASEVYDAFVSYSRLDQTWVRDWLVPHLRRAGLKICIDYECFHPGEPVVCAIERSVQTSRKTLLVLSPSYLNSEWAEFESIL